MRQLLATSLLVLILGVPPLVLGAMALPRLQAGLPSAELRRVMFDRIASRSVAAPRLDRAQETLAASVPGDGESRLWRAEFLALLAGKDRARLENARTLTIEGLSAQPANPRGWTLLCEIDVALARDDAARCLDTAFFIGPFDWFVARRRTALSVFLWPQLDADTRDDAVRRLRLIWEVPQLQPIDLEVARTANGREMLKQAFADEPVLAARILAGAAP